MEAVVGRATELASDSSRHPREPDNRPDGRNYPLHDSLPVADPAPEVSVVRRTNWNRKIGLRDGLLTEEEQYCRVQAAVHQFLGANFGQSDAGHHHEQAGQKKERSVRSTGW